MDTRQQPNRRLRNDTKQTYLQAYNVASAFLWLAVLGRVLLLVPLVGRENVYGGVGTWTRWTQTLALAEVGHAALGTWLFRHPPHLKRAKESSVSQSCFNLTST